jgi:hypothetical protein
VPDKNPITEESLIARRKELADKIKKEYTSAGDGPNNTKAVRVALQASARALREACISFVQTGVYFLGVEATADAALIEESFIDNMMALEGVPPVIVAQGIVGVAGRTIAALCALWDVQEELAKQLTKASEKEVEQATEAAKKMSVN